MGTRNRQRRAEKLRRRQRASAPRSERRADAPPARELIYAAAEALRRSDVALCGELVRVLADDALAIAGELDAVLGEALRALRQGNWDPAEVARQTERRLGPRPARYVADVIGRDGGGARWWRGRRAPPGPVGA